MKAWLILPIVILASGCTSVDLAPESNDQASKAFQPPPGLANLYVVNDGRLRLNKTHLFPVLLDGRRQREGADWVRDRPGVGVAAIGRGG